MLLPVADHHPRVADLGRGTPILMLVGLGLLQSARQPVRPGDVSLADRG